MLLENLSSFKRYEYYVPISTSHVGSSKRVSLFNRKKRLSSANPTGNAKQQTAERGELCLNKAPLHTPRPVATRRDIRDGGCFDDLFPVNPNPKA